MPDGQHKQATSAQRQTLPISHVRTESALRHGIIKAGFAAWTFVRGAPRRAVKPARPRPSRQQARLTGGRSRPNREPIKAAFRRYVVT